MGELKSVKEHNDEKIKARREWEEARLRTGVACPMCGKELRWSSSFNIFTTYPPKTWEYAYCPDNCGVGALRLEL